MFSGIIQVSEVIRDQENAIPKERKETRSLTFFAWRSFIACITHMILMFCNNFVNCCSLNTWLPHMRMTVTLQRGLLFIKVTEFISVRRRYQTRISGPQTLLSVLYNILGQ